MVEVVISFMSTVPRQCKIHGISLVHQLCGEIDGDRETGVSVAGSVADIPMLGLVSRLVKVEHRVHQVDTFLQGLIDGCSCLGTTVRREIHGTSHGISEKPILGSLMVAQYTLCIVPCQGFFMRKICTR